MKVNQIYEIVNTIAGEITGESDVVAEDLSNLVEVGKTVFDATSVDNYCRKLVDHIGRVTVNSREFRLSVPDLVRDSWEYGAAKERIWVEMPDTEENPSWNLQSGEVYEQDTFSPPNVSVTFWQTRDTYQVASSFTEDQIKGSFSNANQMNVFLSGVQLAIQNRLRLSLDSLIMRCINHLMAETIHSDYPTETYTASSGIKAVNLLKLYNDEAAPATPLTTATALYNPDFLRFAAARIAMYTDRLSAGPVKLFNVNGKVNSTPRDAQKVVLLSQFESQVRYFMESDTFNADMVALPGHDTVAFWQGCGTDYSLADCSTIHVNTASGDEVALPYIVGTIFDREAAMVCCEQQKTTTHYNGNGDFVNFWYKMFFGLLNDLNYNCVVFFLA